MLRTTFIIWLLLLSVQIFAQKPVKISGTIAGHTQDSIRLGEQQVKIRNNGTFSFSPVVTKPQYQKLKVGEQEIELYLEPGKNLVLAFEESNLPATVTFEGKLATVNQYLLQQAKMNESVNAYASKHWGTLFSKSEEDFIATIDSIRNLYMKPLSELLRKDRSLHAWFLIQQRADLSYPFLRSSGMLKKASSSCPSTFR